MQIKVISMMGKLYEWHVKVGHVESTFHSAILDNLSKGTPARSYLFHSLSLVVGDMANYELITHVKLLLCGNVMWRLSKIDLNIIIKNLVLISERVRWIVFPRRIESTYRSSGMKELTYGTN